VPYSLFVLVVSTRWIVIFSSLQTMKVIMIIGVGLRHRSKFEHKISESAILITITRFFNTAHLFLTS